MGRFSQSFYAQPAVYGATRLWLAVMGRWLAAGSQKVAAEPST